MADRRVDDFLINDAHSQTRRATSLKKLANCLPTEALAAIVAIFTSIMLYKV